MENKQCIYVYTREGMEFITPSLDKAIQRTDQKTIKCKYSDEKEYRIIDIQ